MIHKARQEMYLDYIVQIADSYVGVREEPRNSNLGPQVEIFQRNVGEHCVGGSWCSCFCYSVCKEAAELMHARTKVRRSARALAHWHFAPEDDLEWIRVSESDLVRPGMMFVQVAKDSALSGARRRTIERASGHIGFVTSRVNSEGWFQTKEGNTNPSGSREGGGVYSRSRHIDDRIVGFVVPDFEF